MENGRLGEKEESKMRIKTFYSNVIQTALIVSEVFQNMLRNGMLDEDYINHENDADIYAELAKIAEDIEDELTSMDETERYSHGLGDIREWAEERIFKLYGKTLEVRQFSFDTTSTYELPEIQRALEKAGIDVLGIEWKATWNTKVEYDKGLAPTSSN